MLDGDLELARVLVTGKLGEIGDDRGADVGNELAIDGDADQGRDDALRGRLDVGRTIAAEPVVVPLEQQLAPMADQEAVEPRQDPRGLIDRIHFVGQEPPDLGPEA